MSRDRVYIAGPMRGIPLYNFPAFDAAAAILADQFDVVNPAQLDRDAGVNEHTDPLSEGFMRDAMRRDLSAICDCDAILLLEGWERSSGVAVELALARLLGLRVFRQRFFPDGRMYFDWTPEGREHEAELASAGTA